MHDALLPRAYKANNRPRVHELKVLSRKTYRASYRASLGSSYTSSTKRLGDRLSNPRCDLCLTERRSRTSERPSYSSGGRRHQLCPFSWKYRLSSNSSGFATTGELIGLRVQTCSDSTAAWGNPLAKFINITLTSCFQLIGHLLCRRIRGLRHCS